MLPCLGLIGSIKHKIFLSPSTILKEKFKPSLEVSTSFISLNGFSTVPKSKGGETKLSPEVE